MRGEVVTKDQGNNSIAQLREVRTSRVWGIDSLPKDWREKPLKCVAIINDDKVSDDTDAEYEIEYVDIGNVTLETGITSTERLRFESAPSRARRQVRSGDTIVSTVRTYLKAVAHVADPPENLVVSTGFAVLRPKAEIDPGYLYRLAQSQPFVECIMAHSVGVSYPAINSSDLGKFAIPIPPIDEQRAIAAFLDRETGKIDGLLAKNERLVELLNEKRTVLITDTVTKGLNPTSPTVESKIPWLGRVPSHWVVKRLKYAVTFQRGHDLPTSDRVPGTIRVVSSAGPSAWHDQAAAKAPGIVTGRYGTIGAFHLIEEDYWPLNTTLYSIDLHQNVPRFAWYMLHVLKDVFLVNSGKSAVPGVDRNDLHPVPVAIPRVEEQQRIVEYLDTEVHKFEALMKEVYDAMDRLREYRSALISAAVTGQIDVLNYRSEVPCH